MNGEIEVDCGSAGLEARLDEAARRTKQLAAGADIAAQYQLGREHRYVPGEPEVLWLKRAAKGGHASNNVTIRVDAVVLYGSRARGTGRATSDWDIAILSHAAPDDEEAATRLLGKLERVYPVVMKPESIEAHCNQGTRLESAIARQGRLLAGEWTPPPCRIENLDVNPEDLKRNLDTATDDLRCAFLVLCEAAFNGLLYVPKVVEESQQAAEALAKTVIAGFGLSPATVHDLDALATHLKVPSL